MTYEWILEHELQTGIRPTGSGPTSSRAGCSPTATYPPSRARDIRFVRDHVVPVHETMVAAADGRNVWIVGGGDLAGQFADHGLLDEVIVMIAPVTFGDGAPLLPRRVELPLQELAPNGVFACARFTVARAAGDRP